MEKEIGGERALITPPESETGNEVHKSEVLNKETTQEERKEPEIEEWEVFEKMEHSEIPGMRRDYTGTPPKEKYKRKKKQNNKNSQTISDKTNTRENRFP